MISLKTTDDDLLHLVGCSTVAEARAEVDRLCARIESQRFAKMAEFCARRCIYLESVAVHDPGRLCGDPAAERAKLGVFGMFLVILDIAERGW